MEEFGATITLPINNEILGDRSIAIPDYRTTLDIQIAIDCYSLGDSGCRGIWMITYSMQGQNHESAF
ncbi:MAG: hypothetical protein MZV63_10180 [Marinilabiliales bacterium]|nr:hypothetical protein [Marinilabiliales bacterium]